MSQEKASEVVRRFRIWRHTHRPKTSVAELATEVGLPEKVLKAILLGTNNAPAYIQRLSAIMDASVMGSSGAMAEIAQASEWLPDPHTSVVYSFSMSSALKARQGHLVEDEPRPYCLISRQDTAPRHCILAQNARDCVGCAATTKFCLECGYDLVAFPGSDLCAYCLTKAVNNPLTDIKTVALPIRVSCQQSAGQKISTATCGRMQSTACGNCNAATRICLDCKERRVRYPQFGACIRCYTALMSPDWTPLSEDTMRHMAKQREEFFAKEAPPSIVVEKSVVVEEPMEPEPAPVQDVIPSLSQALAQVWKRAQELHPGLDMTQLIGDKTDDAQIELLVKSLRDANMPATPPTIKSQGQKRNKVVSIDDLCIRACEHDVRVIHFDFYGVSAMPPMFEWELSPSSLQKYKLIRGILIYLLFEYTSESVESIGKTIGVSRATAYRWYKEIKSCKGAPGFREDLKNLREMIVEKVNSKKAAA